MLSFYCFLLIFFSLALGYICVCGVVSIFTFFFPFFSVVEGGGGVGLTVGVAGER